MAQFTEFVPGGDVRSVYTRPSVNIDGKHVSLHSHSKRVHRTPRNTARDARLAAAAALQAQSQKTTGNGRVGTTSRPSQQGVLPPLPVVTVAPTGRLVRAGTPGMTPRLVPGRATIDDLLPQAHGEDRFYTPAHGLYSSRSSISDGSGHSSRASTPQSRTPRSRLGAGVSAQSFSSRASDVSVDIVDARSVLNGTRSRFAVPITSGEVEGDMFMNVDKNVGAGVGAGAGAGASPSRGRQLPPLPRQVSRVREEHEYTVMQWRMEPRQLLPSRRLQALGASRCLRRWHTMPIPQ